MNVSRRRLQRASVLIGAVSAAAGAAMLVPTAANAAAPIGADPGHLHLPASGNMSDKPTWSTDTACSANFNSSAKLQVVLDDGSSIAVSGTVTPVTSPFSGTLQGPLSQIALAGGLQNGNTYEFVVMCQTPQLAQDPEQSTFLTISADGTTYTTSATPPSSPATATTTTLSANPTNPNQGDPVTLTATVTASDAAGNDAVGNVEFFAGSNSLGTAAVSGGTASITTSSLPAGDNSITAKFEPTDPTKFASSTSSAQTVTVQGAANSETITVAVAAVSSGSLTLTVDNTPVTMTTPKLDGTDLDSTGTLSPVTVTDSRLPSQPGWDLAGSVSDFTAGAHSFSGSDLGWTPKITAPNTKNDVTAGAAVTAGTNPGLKGGAPLATAAAGAGGGTSKLGADLDLQIPVDTPAGNYSATLTVTLLSK